MDPDFVSLHKLTKKVENAGFVLERSSGPAIAYFARFVSEADAALA